MLNRLRSTLIIFALVLFTSLLISTTTFANDNPNAIFKLIPTQNIFTLLKLNTRTGQLWQVHVSIDSGDLRATFPINLIVLTETPAKDTFGLYPTGNMYNFILLDHTDGRTWQVQWNPKEKYRFIIPIPS